MQYPPLVKGLTVEQYRDRFERMYCRGPIETFDGIKVRFEKSDFNHCFFSSTRRNREKDKPDQNRLERIDWIKTSLEDPGADLRQSYNRNTKAYDPTRRLALVQRNYAIVIRIISPGHARFVTAFLADEKPMPGKMLSTVQMIRLNPKWEDAIREQ